MSVRARLAEYGLYLVLAVVYPFFLVFVAIAVSGERADGMGYGVLFGFITLNIFYSFYFLRFSFLVKMVTAVAVTALGLGITFLVLASGFRFAFDTTQIYTALLTYGLSSIIGWEISYRVLAAR